MDGVGQVVDAGHSDRAVATGDTVRPPRPHRFTRAEYAILAESGALGPNPRVELMYGEIVEMSPQNRRHANAIVRLTKLLGARIGDRMALRVQLPFAAADNLEPEPDFCIVPDTADLEPEHPSTAPLVIEVADSSLAYDRQTKLPMYALAGVAEYWIVDIEGRAVEVYTEPVGDGYANKRTARVGDTVSAVAVAGLVVRVGEIFGV